MSEVLCSVGSKYKVMEVYSYVVKHCSRKFKNKEVSEHVAGPEYHRIYGKYAYAHIGGDVILQRRGIH